MFKLGGELMIRQSLYFKFNNEESLGYGISNVNISSGMQSEPFAAQPTIREVEIRGNSKRYFQGIQLSPLEFTLTLAFNDSFSSDDLRAVSRWLLNKNYYLPLQFFDGTGEDLNQIYYAVFLDSELTTNCLNQGYISLKVRCNDAYSYSGIYSSEIYDYTVNPAEGTSFVFENNGDVDTQPVIIVEIISGSTFTITNNSNGGDKISFTGLSTGEIITLDNENEIVESSLANTYRYDNMTSDSKFLSIPRGFNYMNIKGNVKVQWKHEEKFLTG